MGILDSGLTWRIWKKKTLAFLMYGWGDLWKWIVVGSITKSVNCFGSNSKDQCAFGSKWIFKLFGVIKYVPILFIYSFGWIHNKND